MTSRPFDLSQFVAAPETEIGLKTLRIDIYVALHSNETIVLFRRKGDVLNASDLAAFAKIPKKDILVLKSELSSLPPLSTAVPPQFQKAKEALKQELAQGNVKSATVQKEAGTLLKGIQGASATDHLKSMPQIVEDLVGVFSNSPSLQTYLKLLDISKKESADDPLAIHHRLVSAMGILIMLCFGDTTVDELMDIGTAAMAHDLSLTLQPEAERKLHFSTPIKSMEAKDRALHYNQIENTIRLLKDHKVTMTPGALRTIELHHENWDGSGFKGMSGKQVFRPARVLRIADEIVPTLQDVNNSLGFALALAKLGTLRGEGDFPVFDPDIVKRISKLS